MVALVINFWISFTSHDVGSELIPFRFRVVMSNVQSQPREISINLSPISSRLYFLIRRLSKIVWHSHCCFRALTSLRKNSRSVLKTIFQWSESTRIATQVSIANMEWANHKKVESYTKLLSFLSQLDWSLTRFCDQGSKVISSIWCCCWL